MSTFLHGIKQQCSFEIANRMNLIKLLHYFGQIDTATFYPSTTNNSLDGCHWQTKRFENLHRFFDGTTANREEYY